MNYCRTDAQQIGVKNTVVVRVCKVKSAPFVSPKTLRLRVLCDPSAILANEWINSQGMLIHTGSRGRNSSVGHIRAFLVQSQSSWAFKGLHNPLIWQASLTPEGWFCFCHDSVQKSWRSRKCREHLPSQIATLQSVVRQSSVALWRTDGWGCRTPDSWVASSGTLIDT